MDVYSNLNVKGKIKQKATQGTESDDVVLYGTTETANTFLGRVPAALPKPANANNGKAIISNGTGFEFGEAGKVDQVQVNGTAIAGDGTQTKIANIVPGTGLTSSGGTINHSNSITANTSGVGSTTKIPVIKYDAQGHITSTSTVTVYPPTSVGTSGQLWQSDGNGTGAWQTLDTAPTANSTKAVTSGGVKTYVDDQVLRNTANFLGTFDVETDLQLPETASHSDIETKLGQMTWSPAPTKNDFVYIQFDLSSDPGVIDRYERYQYTGSAWEYMLTIQNPSFSTTQWAAINSGVTSTKVGTYDTHVANTKIHVPTTTTAAMVLTSANNAAPVWRTISGSGYSTDDGNIVITNTTYSAGTKLSLSGTQFNHSNTTRSDSTSTGAPGYGGTFTAVDGITTDATGHVTAVNVKTVTIPASDNTDAKVQQKGITTAGEYPILLKYNTGTSDVAANYANFGKATNAVPTINPSTGNITAPKLNNLTLTAATTGFTISGGTTSKTLTVGADYTLAAACAKAVTDSSSASAIGTGTSLPTERDIYYGLPTINNSHTYTSSTTIYAPSGAGTANQILKSSGGTSAPVWANITSLMPIVAEPVTLADM